MASLTQWTWVWVNSWEFMSWWWTERPGMLWSMGRKETQLSNWTELLSMTGGIHKEDSNSFFMPRPCIPWFLNQLRSKRFLYFISNGLRTETLPTSLTHSCTFRQPSGLGRVPFCTWETGRHHLLVQPCPAPHSICVHPVFTASWAFSIFSSDQLWVF